MTNFTKNLMVAAAAMVVTAGMASAQSMKAEIPFAFDVNGKTMPSGTYDVGKQSRSGAPLFTLRTQGSAAMALPDSAHDPDKEWRADARPRLAFWCGDGHCTLAEIWKGYGTPAYRMPRPKTVDVGTKIAVVLMRADKGE